MRAQLDRSSIEQDDADRLVLAAHETAANVVRHALRDRPGDEFEMKVLVDMDRITVTFLHSGLSFDPADAPAPNFDGLREGGLGLFFIAACVDSVTYHQDDAGKNRITLIRSFHRQTLVER